MLSLSVSLIWLLAMLAAAVHVRDAESTAKPFALLAAAFTVVLPLAIWLSPQPNWVAVLVTILAIWRLIGGRSARLGPVVAGITAALAASLLVAAGLSLTIAAAVTAIALLAAFLLRGREPGRDGSAHELVLVLVALAMPVVGLFGDLLFGWQSATMLSSAAVELDTPAPPVWSIGIAVLAVLAGLFKGLRTKQ